MVPKIVAKGTSFKGAAQYYLHDKDADTNERVEWAETRNLATDDPDVAWRVMAATAMCQHRLKTQAGIPATGRKSDNVVLTYSLAWHPDEKKHLTKEEMQQAAYDTLDVLGAGQHQALIVCHNDEPHPHVHIMVNRVSPIDGRMLSSSKEKLNLSKWAQAYEEHRGKIWCKERVKNNQAREVLKQFTRAAKDKPRHIHEIEAKAKTLSRRKPAEAKALSQSEKEKDLALSRKGREMQDKHKQHWDELAADHKARKAEIIAKVKSKQKQSKRDILDKNKPVKQGMKKRHDAEQRLFERREKRLFGRVQNIVSGIREKQVDGEERQNTVGRVFKLISSKQARHDNLSKRQARDNRKFNADQNKEVSKSHAHIKAAGNEQKEKNLSRFYQERKDIKFKQSMDNAKLKAEWKQRGVDRKEAWREFRVGQYLTKHGVGRAGMQRDRNIDRGR